MSVYSRESLKNPEAAACAERLLDELMDSERILDEQDPEPEQITHKTHREYKARYPDYVVVRSDSLWSSISKAAFAGAGFPDPDEAPREYREQISDNSENFLHEIMDLFKRFPPGENDLLGFSYRFYALERDAVKEMLAHHYLVVGRLSRFEIEQRS